MIPLLLADPATLTALALGGSALAGLGTTAATLFNQPKAPAQPGPTPPASTPTGTPSTNKSATGPSFLAAAAAPPQSGQTGGKTLLGQ